MAIMINMGRKVEDEILDGNLDLAIKDLGLRVHSYEEAKKIVHSAAREAGVLKERIRRYEGFCSQLPIRRGSTVLVHRGTRVHVGNRKVDDNGPVRKAGRSYRISVDHVVPGTNQRLENGTVIPMSNPKVVWIGSGGNWMSCDINEIREIKDNDENLGVS